MTAIGNGIQHSPAKAQATMAALLPLYVGTIFLSAFLLFSVQPMFTKMILPVLGGSPSVWSVAMVFFQALLLAGYAYAHLLASHLRLGVAASIHLVVLVCALATMPIQLATGWGKPPASGEAFWLLGLFLVSVGFPFFALAANGPLLQAWFARSSHPHARDPYFLYGASNIGSFAALIAYPLAIEPLIALDDQSRWWMAGFGVLAVLIASSAAMAGRTAAAPSVELPAEAEAPVTGSALWHQRLGWIALSFVPSGLLISVTAHISTDVAAAPLLWVAPLALFLLTFVLAFRDRPVVSDGLLTFLQVCGTALALMPRVTPPGLLGGLGLHLGLFLVNAMICHGALYRRRPSSQRLTEFYLCLSLGGVLGGIFCGLLAPRIFSNVFEYPLLLAAALLCRPGFLQVVGERLRVGLRSAALIVIAFCAVFWLVTPMLSQDWLVFGTFAPFALALIAAWRKPEYVAPLALALCLAAMAAQGPLFGNQASRSFFGVHKIGVSPTGEFRTLSHGTTLHGAMRIANPDGTPVTGRPAPTTYYEPDGAMATAVASVRARQGGSLGAVQVIGLGAGTLACHSRPEEQWTFLEIDPEVVRIATDDRLFRFISGCAPQTRIVLGDARLTLAEQPGGNSLIMVDAFSSDAIPTHLMTREALGLYLSKLRPDGALFMHISNRHLELRHILARAAVEHGLVAYVRHEPDAGSNPSFRAASIVVGLARRPEDLGAIVSNGDWTRVAPDMSRRPWSDDFSNVIEAIVDRAKR